MKNNNIRVYFISRGNKYLASVSFIDFDDFTEDLKNKLEKAARIYEKHIKIIKKLLIIRDNFKSTKNVLTSRFMWMMGDKIFVMIDELDKIGITIDCLYDNLTRDLNISRTTLKRLISLRRYFNNINELPPKLCWSKIKDAPKKYSPRI